MFWEDDLKQYFIGTCEGYISNKTKKGILNVTLIIGLVLYHKD